MGELDALDRAAEVLAPRGRRDVAVGPMTTYRVGGRAALFLEARSESDLVLARRAVSSGGVPVLVLGKGSNLLLADAGFPGLVVTLGEAFAAIEVSAGGLVGAGAAVSLPVLARRTVSAGLTGMEWAVGVPGSVGGAVRMNAGGHGSDVSRTLVGCRFVDLCGGVDGEVGAEHLDFAYRRSTVAAHHVVTGATFALVPGDQACSEAELAEIVRWRRENQPGGQNAGSVFTNPPDDSAGRLVEAAGLKGLRVGSAHVSTKHANFIQADPEGSADDVWRLVLEVQRLVEDRLGVRLS
ncbi:MAG TPA: UDP-N-acetylmuramate dehydrogenase, partial [Acidimicrobiales bacterium]|nr:UDP-N-acetylmuramate dehydrogenase [Acidimicrobiales bacterium]